MRKTPLLINGAVVLFESFEDLVTNYHLDLMLMAKWAVEASQQRFEAALINARIALDGADSLLHRTSVV